MKLLRIVGLATALGVALGASVGAEDLREVTVSPGGLSQMEGTDQRCPSFSWAAVEMATGYNLVVYEVDHSGDWVIGDGQQLAVSFEPVLDIELPGGALTWTPVLRQCLERTGQYAWSVRPQLRETPGEWSQPRLFEVSGVPSREELEQALETVRRHLGGDEDGQGQAAPEEADFSAPVVKQAATAQKSTTPKEDLLFPLSQPTMIVENTDTSETGDGALLVVNRASPSSAGRATVPALEAVAAGGENEGATQTGAYGAVIRSLHWRGMYAKGSAGYYAAVFDSNAGIEITGGGVCSGCSMAFNGLNGGSEVISTGDFVAVLGVEMDPDLNIPIMRVRKASGSSDAVAGVARARMTRTPVAEFDGVTTGGFDQAPGAVEPGAFLSVVVQGLVQANVGAVSGLSLGDTLALGAAGVAVATEADPTIGRAMSAVSQDGTVWVMLGGQ